MFDTFTSTQVSLRYISLRYMLGLFDAFTSTHNMFGLCTSTQDFTSIYAIRLNIIRNNHHCRLFHFDSDFHLDSCTSTSGFPSIHSLRQFEKEKLKPYVDSCTSIERVVYRSTLHFDPKNLALRPNTFDSKFHFDSFTSGREKYRSACQPFRGARDLAVFYEFL